MSAFIGDLQVRGKLKCDDFDAPTETIGNAAIDPDDPIKSEKCYQQVPARYKQDHGSAVVSARAPIHQVNGTSGTLFELHACLAVACIGAATVTVMIKKNGTDMLAAALQLDSGDAAYADVMSASFVSAANVRGDVYEVVVTATAGGGTVGQGLLVTLINRELPE